MSSIITEKNYEVNLDRDLRFIINNSINTDDFKEAIYIISIQYLSKKYKIIKNFSKILRDKINLILVEMKEQDENNENNENHFCNENKSSMQVGVFNRSWCYHLYG